MSTIDTQDGPAPASDPAPVVNPTAVLAPDAPLPSPSIAYAGSASGAPPDTFVVSGVLSGGRALSEESPRPRDLPGGFRPDIEGLRAVAILLVVLYHAGLRQLPGGYVGVDVFFVISGFLITSQLLRESGATGRVSIGRFYARRAIRLLPAATLVIAVTLIASWAWLPATRLRGLAQDALAANGYFLNYRLAHLGTDYRTASAAPSPLQHFWSLAVEEQFYLVIPVLLLVATVLAGSRKAFGLALALITGASLWWSVHSSVPSPIWAYFGAPSRGWELGAGALLATGVAAFTALPKPLAVVLRVLGLAAIGYSAYRFDAGTPFPGYHAGLPVAGAAAVIVAGCAGPGQLLAGSLLRVIGARSYSWYLWHWPVLLIAPFALSRPLGPIGKLLAVAFAFGLASATYSLVEHPLRINPMLRAHPLQAAKLAVSLTAAVVLLAVLLPMLPPRSPLGIGDVAAVSLSGQGSRRTLALAKAIKAATAVTNLPANLRPSLQQAAMDVPVIYRDGCHLDVAPTTTPRKCERFGDPKGKRVAVLFGDSHAAQWFPAMQAIARQRRWRLAVFTKGACSAAAVTIVLPAIKRPYTECRTWRARTLSRIRALHPVVVVMSSNADGGQALGVTGSQDAAWARAWQYSARSLTEPGTRVVYLNDTPWPKGDVPDCLAQHPRQIQKCAQRTSVAVGKARRRSVAAALARTGAAVVDPMPWFCSLKACPVVLGNLLVYLDDSHMTTRYSRLLAPLLAEQLPAAGAP